MYGHLKNRATYDEVLKEAQEYPYGYIALNVDEKPVIIKHPHEEEWLIIGYSKETGKVAFVELHENGTHRKLDPERLKERWRTVNDKKFIVKLGSDRESVFIQEFLFMFDYHWNGQKEQIVQKDLGLIKSSGREVYIYARIDKGKGFYLTYSVSEPGESRKWMNFRGFWDMFLKIVAIW